MPKNATKEETRTVEAELPFEADTKRFHKFSTLASRSEDKAIREADDSDLTNAYVRKRNGGKPPKSIKLVGTIQY